MNQKESTPDLQAYSDNPGMGHIKETINVYSNERNKPSGFRLPTGLVNMGSTCYLNSMLQSLYVIPEFRSIVIHRSEHEGNKTTEELKNLFKVMQKRNVSSIHPEKFFYSLGYDHWAKQVPRDASMERRSLFSLLRKPNGWPALNKLFCGKMKNVTLFPCGYKLEVTQTFEDFHLPLRLTTDSATVKTLEEALKNTVSPQPLSEECALTCPNCRSVGICKASTFQPVYLDLPRILLVHLARFTFTRSVYRAEKVTDRVTFPLKELDFSNVFDNVYAQNVDYKPPRPKYELLSVVAHCGSLEYGHYITYARHLDTDNGQWYLFNDNLVHRVEETEVKSTFGGSWDSFCAHYLVYRQKDCATDTAANRGSDDQMYAKFKYIDYARSLSRTSL